MFSDESGDEKISPVIEKNPPKEGSWGEFFRFVIIAILIVVPFRLFIAQPFIVSGASMSPSFETGEYLIVDELTYRFESPKRGDVIILKKPNQESEYLIKRIVGLPGETMEIKNGEVFIKGSNGTLKKLAEQGYVINKSYENETVTLGGDEYFAMGDNRPVSLDSRFIGPIPKDHIVGKALVRLFPFNKINWLPAKCEKCAVF